MTTQIIPGVLRETNNPLLLKSGIGKPQPRGFIIPPNNFTYGITTGGKSCGTADTFVWHANIQQTKLNEQSAKRDFISLNKAATQAGLVTAQEHFQYRATHADRLKRRKNNSDTTLTTKLPAIANMVYGVATKPSTPVFDLLEHKYRDTWLNEAHRDQLTLKKKEREMKKTASKTYAETCASRLRRYSPKVDPPPLWQMPKFKNNAKPKLETFRSEEERRKAFSHHISDSTSRTGVTGHGIYEDAKS